jgi:hypothetical protein
MYNTLMTHTHTIRLLALGALFCPVAAMAVYTSPEEVLSSSENFRYFNPPPNPRDLQAIQLYQQAQIAAHRAEVQAALPKEGEFAESSEANTEPDPTPAHEAAPAIDQNALLQMLINQLAPKQEEVAPESTIDDRILDRLRQQQLLADYNAEAARLAGLQPLHSGAPLTESGPGTIAALVVLSGAAYWTFRKARKMEK